MIMFFGFSTVNLLIHLKGAIKWAVTQLEVFIVNKIIAGKLLTE